MIILFTLFVVPGVISRGTISGPLDHIAAMVALTVRNGGFVLLILYLTDLSEDSLWMVPKSKGLFLKTLLPRALGIGIVLFTLSLSVGLLMDIVGDTERFNPFTGVETAHSPATWTVLVVMLLAAALMEEPGC